LYEVDVAPPTGQPFRAVATERGDIVSSAQHLDGNTPLPPGIAALTRDIFRVAPADLWAMTATYYWVTVAAPGARIGATAQEAGSQQYAIRFDPIGRVLEVKSPEQLHATGWRTFADAPAPVAQRLQQVGQQHVPGAAVAGVKQVPN